MLQKCRKCCGTGWQYCTVCQSRAQWIGWKYVKRFNTYEQGVCYCWNCCGTGRENCEFCHGSGKVPKYDS